MRPISTADAAILASEDRRVLWRVLVTYHSTQVDLGAVGAVTSGTGARPGTSFLESASWGESVDDVQMSATVVVSRKVEQMNLAPLVTASRLNAVPGTYAYDPLLALSRAVEIQWALVTANDSTGPTWRRAFTGYIDRVSPGTDTITIDCRSNSRVIQKTIRRERVYAYSTTAGKGLLLWQASTAYSVGDLVVPTDAKSSVGKYFTCTVAGTSGTTEPTWPTSGTVASGGATFSVAGSTTTTTGTALQTVMQQMLDDNLGSGVVSLSTPTSPAWAVRYFLQKREVLLDALRTLAMQRGWDVRDKWDAGSGAFRFTLYEPQRTKTTPDYTLSPGWLKELSPVTQDIATVRNWVRVYYFDSQDKDAGGVPKRKYVEATDSGSIAQHGELYMEISEAYTSHIDSASEAQTLANAARDDLSTPFAERVAPVYFFPFCELGDLYRFQADEFHDTDLDLAVVGYRHELSQDGSATTSLTCRGKPAGANRLWFKLAAFSGYNDNSQDVQQNVGAGLTVSALPIIKGARISVFVPTESKSSVLDGFEWHVSTTPTFTPNSTTFVSKGAARSLELSDRTPGTTYYVRVVPYGTSNGKLIRGEPTDPVSFTPQYVEPRTLQPYVFAGALPPNADFEANNTAGAPPDTWTVEAGTWGATITTTSDCFSGNTAIRFLASQPNTSTLVSQLMTIRPNERYMASAIIKSAGTTSLPIAIGMRFYSSVGGSIISTASVNPASTNGSWVTSVVLGQAPSTARYASIYILLGSSGAADLLVDCMEFSRASIAQEPWHLVGSAADASYEVAYQNGYTTWGSPYGQVAFRINTLGNLEFKGRAKAPATAPGSFATIFTLPSGYRPTEKRMIFMNVSSGATQFEVNTDGQIKLGSISGGGEVSFEGVSVALSYVA